MRPRRVLPLLFLAVLAACGPEKPYYRDGEFSLGTYELAAQAIPGGPSPSSTVAITIVGKDVVTAGIVDRPGTARPAWLGAEISGTGRAVTLVVTLGTSLEPGTYRSNVTVVTYDRAGDAITARDLTVTYTVKPPVRFWTRLLQVSDFVGTSNTHTYYLDVQEGWAQPWSAHTDAPWLAGARASSGAGVVTVQTGGLPAGTHVGHVVLEGELPGETDTLAVELTLSPP